MLVELIEQVTKSFNPKKLCNKKSKKLLFTVTENLEIQLIDGKEIPFILRNSSTA